MALAFSVLAVTNPTISDADNAIDSFISASSVTEVPKDPHSAICRLMQINRVARIKPGCQGHDPKSAMIASSAFGGGWKLVSRA